MKKCGRCLIEKDESEFFFKNKEKNILHSMCKECKNKRRAKPKTIKPHLCQDCGETNPEDFYEGHKGRCKGCVVKIVCEKQKKKKELEPV
jgi:hypothetical protein